MNLELAQAFFQMSSPAAFAIAVLFGSMAIAIATAVTISYNKNARRLAHIERMAEIPANKEVALAADANNATRQLQRRPSSENE